MEMTRYEPGVPCWVDLQTSDQRAARAFYSELFGWSFDDVPTGDESTYSIAMLRGHMIAAITSLAPDPAAPGAPPQWSTYVCVDSADESAAKVARFGGVIVAPAMDAQNAGRMAVVRDPGGAMFNLWQAREHIGAEWVNEPNTWCWSELYTNDLDSAGRFYRDVFGWSVEAMASAGGSILACSLAGREIASMMEIRAEWGEVPPHWAVYFAVSDCEASVARASSLGAQVYLEPREIPQLGTFAGIEDPQGAHLMIIAMGR